MRNLFEDGGSDGIVAVICVSIVAALLIVVQIIEGKIGLIQGFFDGALDWALGNPDKFKTLLGIVCVIILVGFLINLFIFNMKYNKKQKKIRGLVDGAVKKGYVHIIDYQREGLDDVNKIDIIDSSLINSKLPVIINDHCVEKVCIFFTKSEQEFKAVTENLKDIMRSGTNNKKEDEYRVWFSEDQIDDVCKLVNENHKEQENTISE